MKLLLSLMALFMLPSVAGLGSEIGDNTLGQNLVDNSVAYSPEAHHDANYYSLDLVVDDSLSYLRTDVLITCRTNGFTSDVQFSVDGNYSLISVCNLDDGKSYNLCLNALYTFEKVATTITARQYDSQSGQYITRSETFYSVLHEYYYISLSTTSMEHAEDCADLEDYGRIPEHTRETDLPFINYWNEKNNAREEPFVTSIPVSWRDNHSYRFYLRNGSGSYREPLSRVNVGVFTPNFAESPQYVFLTDDNGEITVPWYCTVSFLRLMSCSVDHYFSDADVPNDPGDPDNPIIVPQNRALNGDNSIFPHGVKLFRAKDREGELSMYYKDFFVESDSAMDFIIEVNDSSSFGKAMKVTQTLAYGKRYVEEMTGDAMEINETYKAYYPCSGDRSYYATKGSVNHLYDSMYISEDDYANPDVILHEYGHCVQRKYRFGDSLGIPHYIGTDYASSLNTLDGLRLAWGEAWPTVFANLVTQYYASYFGSLDTSFDSHDCSFDLETPNVFYGHRSEEDVAAVLYDLFDAESNSESFDMLAYGHKNFWKLMKEASLATNGIKTFSDFLNYYQNTHSSQDNDKLQRIVRKYGFSASATANGIGTLNSAPFISWSSVNGANKYEIIIYDGYGARITMHTTYLTCYGIDDYDWRTILLSPTSAWYYEVIAYTQVNGVTYGGYSSGKIAMAKPTGIVNGGNIYLFHTNSNRIVKKDINLSADSVIKYTFRTNTSGYTTFQTVGPYGSKIELYDSSMNLLASDNAGIYGGMYGKGYGTSRQRNGFIRRYCYANTNYTLLIRDCDGGRNYHGTLIVMQDYPYPTNSSGYDSAYSLSQYVTDNCYFNVQCYQEKTTVFNFKPLSGYGTYTIELDSNFDTYLYVVDTSTGDVYEDDDDAGNCDAKVTFSAYNVFSYLIMVTQYDPSDNPSPNNGVQVHIYKN